MADAPDIQDEDFAKALAADFDDKDIAENPATPPAPDDANNPAPATTPPAQTPNVEEPKKDEPAVPADPNKKDEEPATPPANQAPATQGDPATAQAPETPPASEEQKPLTEEGVRRLLSEARTEERESTNELKNTYQDVMDSYYPEGISDVLIDQSTGKELRTPQDVVDASGGEMSTEQAAQWLMNEKYKLEQNIEGIKKQAVQIAETTVNFKRDSMMVLEKYEPLFKAYPQLQSKAFDLMMRQVKADTQKGVILQAPDVVELYDTYLEPYQKAYEFATNRSATNPVTPATPAPATPGQADRLDETGDGGATTEVDDPNDFAQQVTKELAKGL